MAVYPAYNTMFDAFATRHLRGKPRERTERAEQQIVAAAKASRHMGIDVMVSFSGALLWPFIYPWLQRPPDLVKIGFEELANRWMDARFRCVQKA